MSKSLQRPIDGRRRNWLKGLKALTGTAVLGGSMPSRAHDGPHATPPAGAPARARVAIADVMLTDQQGRRGSLLRDFIGNRIVLANFVFTTCSSACPILSAVFAQVQSSLPAALRQQTRLISLTVDPLTDSPERLAETARKYGSEEGWLWLTGRVESVEKALRGFGALVARPDDHLPMAIVGDAATGEWYRFMGTPSPVQLLELTQKLSSRRTHRKSNT